MCRVESNMHLHCYSLNKFQNHKRQDSKTQTLRYATHDLAHDWWARRPKQVIGKVSMAEPFCLEFYDLLFVICFGFRACEGRGLGLAA